MDDPDLRRLRRACIDKQELFLVEKRYGLCLEERKDALRRKRSREEMTPWVDSAFCDSFDVQTFLRRAQAKCVFASNRERVAQRLRSPCTVASDIVATIDRARTLHHAIEEMGYAPNTSWPAELPLPDASDNVFVNIHRAADITRTAYEAHVWGLKHKLALVKPKVPAADWLDLLTRAKGFSDLQRRFDFNISSKGLVAQVEYFQPALDEQAAELAKSLQPMQSRIIGMLDAFKDTVAQLEQLDETCALAAFGACEYVPSVEDGVNATDVVEPLAKAVYLVQCGFAVQGKTISFRPREAFVCMDPREQDDGMFSRRELLRIKRETFAQDRVLFHTPTLS